MKVTTLEGGAQLRTFPTPPAGFDPLNANASTRRQYGLPTPPDDPKQLQRYADIYARTKDKLHFSEPVFGRRKRWVGTPASGVQLHKRHSVLAGDRGAVGGLVHGSGSGGVRFGEETYNWAGMIADAPQGQSIICVTAEMLVPDAHFPNVNTPPNVDEVSYRMWTGIDGEESGIGLIRAGIGADIQKNGSSLFAWYQWATDDDSLHTIDSVPIKVGDSILVVIALTGPGARDANFFLVNESSGAAASWGVSFVGNSNSQLSTSANWIIERPVVSVDPYLEFGFLAPFGTAKFWGCQATSSSANGDTRELLNAGSGFPMTMVDTKGVDAKVIVSGNPEVVECVFENIGVPD